MPFTIRPAREKSFINREDEIRDILSALRNPQMKMGFALYGPRRMGKTSLLLKGADELKGDPKTAVTYFSVWDLVEQDLASFVREFTSAILDSFRTYLPLKFRAKELLQLSYSLLRRQLSQLKLSAQLADDISILLFLEGKGEKDLNSIVSELFALPEKLSQEVGINVHLFIDEFPGLIDLKHNGSKIGDGILKKIRSIYEQYERTTLNISGSIKRTMSLTLFSSSSPFYRQFIAKKIGPLSKEHIGELFKRSLSEERKLTGEALDKVYELTKGIPYYAQFLGKKFYERSEPHISAQEVETALSHFLEEEGNLVFQEEMGSLSDKERRTAIAMALGDLTVSSQVHDILGKEVSNVSQYLIYLTEKGILEVEEKGIYGFVDPVFKMWLKNKYAI